MTIVQIPATFDSMIDAKNTTTNYDSSTTMQLGKRYFGETKTNVYRFLGELDVGTSYIPAGATINTAKMVVYIETGGQPGGAATLTRQRRTDVSEAQCTWDIYKTANNWGTAGCANTTSDIDTATPAQVGATLPSPGSAGFADLMTGLAAFVTDAIANRSNIVRFRIKMDSEADDGVQNGNQWTYRGGANFWYWEVDYTSTRRRTGAAFGSSNVGIY